jgi:biopolymer transport protein ExbD
MASQSRSDDDAITGINMTPLVDIMLVLLIIFMVAARLDGPAAAIGIDLPKASSGTTEETPRTLSIAIGSDGQLRLDGKPIAIAELEREAAVAAMRSAEAQAVVAADRTVPYQRVVDVVDAVRRAEIKKLALAVEGG